ncbi:hypothetical protein CLOSTASPAR_01659 [[Clostridium] asparagiforme DSM 15981]|uniref:Uncharacterized protein n=1 Tax=[Clostridium] asparagiforme DSM 15981 TaxID=518636 RepID=C0CXD9_9FIRM|nr:hypothetical protein CLOSTASPAR_01659 [[Clostridium] asparagiforme DSM 15981]
MFHIPYPATSSLCECPPWCGLPWADPTAFSYIIRGIEQDLQYFSA